MIFCYQNVYSNTNFEGNPWKDLYLSTVTPSQHQVLRDNVQVFIKAT